LASFKRALAALSLLISFSAFAEKSSAPEVWFHIIGGNASKEGLVADLDAIKEAGISGIQFFHGQGDGSLWPGVTNPIPCLSGQWTDLVKFMSDECHKRGLTFKMQNCPGWSMSGGPWITPDKAMRKLVCFASDKKPAFDKDDDYYELCTLEVPIEKGARMITLPAPSKFNHDWCYEPDIEFSICTNGVKEWTRQCPVGCWSDTWSPEIVTMTFDITGVRGADFRIASARPLQKAEPIYDDVRRLDNWEAKAGHTLRAFESDSSPRAFVPNDKLTLTFGHVNMKRHNHPAPPEATGWECDKLSSDGYAVNWAGYLGSLVKSGVKIDGTLVDSWECGMQNWTWNMEAEFAKRNGYELRPWFPALFGYIVKSVPATEKFLRDWRNTCSRMIEENYYGTIARIAHENGMSVQYETAFGDVIPGDILRYWKFADEPMCEFWSPHENNGFVGSYNFKPILPCASAAHLYGKRRVDAESFTSILTWRERLTDLIDVANCHFARGVTHNVVQAWVHDPRPDDAPPPGGSLGIHGTPFNRRQKWIGQLDEFTDFLARCTLLLERGLPVRDMLLYVGDDVDHVPPAKLDVPECHKYDYCTADALLTRLEPRDGGWMTPDGLRYGMVWLRDTPHLRADTKAKLSDGAARGCAVVTNLAFAALPPPDVIGGGTNVVWEHRREGGVDRYFVATDGDRAWKGTLSFRATGTASLWNPQDGSIVPVVSKFTGGRTEVTLELPSSGCMFVVFDRTGAPAPHQAARRTVDFGAKAGTWYDELKREQRLPASKRKTWSSNFPRARDFPAQQRWI